MTDDMNIVDEMLADQEMIAPTFAGEPTELRKCRRHRWTWIIASTRATFAGPGYYCDRCDKPKDEALSRRGKSARSRGNAYERELAKRLGGARVGQFGGPSDVTVNDLFVIQSKVRKAWPEWMANELAKLPRTGGRIPLLVVADAPGAGHRRRALVVLDLSDWADLHGPAGEPAA